MLQESIGTKLYPLLLDALFGPDERKQRQELSKLKPTVRQMRRGYHKTGEINYDSPEFHRAHLLAVYPHHIPLIFDALKHIDVDTGDLPLNISIALVGGGAAPEILGFIRYMSWLNVDFRSLRVYVLDAYSWETEQKITQEIAQRLWPELKLQIFSLITRFDDSKAFWTDQVQHAIRSVDFVFIQNVISDFNSAQRYQATINIDSILGKMKSNAIMLVVDTHKRGVFDYLNQLRPSIDAKHGVIHEVSRYYFKTLINTPTLVTESLLTNEEHLHPRKNIDYAMLAIQANPKVIRHSVPQPTPQDNRWQKLYDLHNTLEKVGYITYLAPYLNDVTHPDLVLIESHLSVVNVITVADELTQEAIDDAVMTTKNIRAIFSERPQVLATPHLQNDEKHLVWATSVIFAQHDHPQIDAALKEGTITQSCEGMLHRGHLENPQTLLTSLRKFDEELKGKKRYEMDEQLFSILRAAFDSTLLVEHQNSLVGVLTEAQSSLIKRPLCHLDEAQQQVQGTLNLDVEVKTDNTVDIQLIRGVAGSGKTIVLIERAKWLAERYPQARILVLAFNRRLIDDKLKAELQAWPNITVETFHQIERKIQKKSYEPLYNVAQWLKEWFPNELRAIGLDVEFIQREFEWRWEFGLSDDDYLKFSRRGRGKALGRVQRQKINDLHTAYIAERESKRVGDWETDHFPALEQLKAGHDHCHYYDAVLVDESQDFAPSWIAIVKRLLKPNGHLLLVYDPGQTIFRSYTWKEKGINAKGRVKTLTIPFRNTYEIALAAFSILNPPDTETDDDDNISKAQLEDTRLMRGHKPKLIIYDEEDEANLYMHRFEREPSCSCVIVRELQERVSEKEGFVSIKRVKGLEFDSVLVHRIDEYVTSDDAEEIQFGLKQLHMAMTRARQNLTLTCVGQLPAPLESLLAHCDVINERDYLANDDILF